jgi:hypothetical protein
MKYLIRSWERIGIKLFVGEGGGGEEDSEPTILWAEEAGKGATDGKASSTRVAKSL